MMGGVELGEHEGYDDDGSGGITDMLLSKTVHVTSAQILALATNPVDIIPLIAGKLIVPISFEATYNFISIPYTGGDGQLITINGIANLGVFDVANPTQNQVTFGSGLATVAFNNTSSLFSQPLQLVASSGASVADGDGTLDITVWYVVSP